MPLTPEAMGSLQQALQGGSLQRAYRAFLDYIGDLRRHFKDRYPKYSVSSVYQGYLDMTYFALVPTAFKRRGLKIAVVFNYEAFRFEAWLSGRNQGVHRRLWPLFEGQRWTQYRLVAPGTSVDSIVECDLVEMPNFEDLAGLTSAIERGVEAFIKDMDAFLTDN